MATGTNAIATVNDVVGITNDKSGTADNYPGYLCCTKELAIELGANQYHLTSYADNQLVKYSDISPINNSITNFGAGHLFFKIKPANTNYSEYQVVINITMSVTTDSGTFSNVIEITESASLDSNNVLSSGSSPSGLAAILINNLNWTYYYSNNTPTTATIKVNVAIYSQLQSGYSNGILIDQLDSQTWTAYNLNYNGSSTYLNYDGPNQMSGTINMGEYVRIYIKNVD